MISNRLAPLLLLRLFFLYHATTSEFKFNHRVQMIRKCAFVLGLSSHLATPHPTPLPWSLPVKTTHSAGHSKAIAARNERVVLMATPALHCPVDGSKHSTLLRVVLVTSLPPTTNNLPSTTATP